RRARINRIGRVDDDLPGEIVVSAVAQRIVRTPAEHREDQHFAPPGNLLEGAGTDRRRGGECLELRRSATTYAGVVTVLLEPAGKHLPDLTGTDDSDSHFCRS